MITKTLTVDQGSFIDWYYSDLGSSGLREMAYDVIDTLSKTGKYSVDIKEVFENVGYLPISLIDFDGDIELEEKFLEHFEDEEIEEGLLCEIDGIKYELELVE